jgi:hypothetical protein
MSTEKRWQDGVMIILGLWLLISPFALRYANVTGIESISSYVFGIAVVLFASIAVARPQMWEEWINLVLGICLILSPFVLQFGTDTVARWNHIVLGVLVGGDALWAMLQYPVHKTTTR